MASFFAALMGAIPIACIALICIPLFIAEVGFNAFPEIFAEFGKLSELAPDALMEYLKALF